MVVDETMQEPLLRAGRSKVVWCLHRIEAEVINQSGKGYVKVVVVLLFLMLSSVEAGSA